MLLSTEAIEGPEMMRNLRNDASHPAGKLVRREVAYANLTVFPTHLRRIYALMDWLGSD